jgi:hypothetical protein
LTAATRKAQVAQQMVRAVLREDTDASPARERLRYFRRIAAAAVPLRVLHPAAAFAAADRASRAAAAAAGTPATRGGSGGHGGSGGARGARTRARWIIVTDNRLFYLQVSGGSDAGSRDCG